MWPLFGQAGRSYSPWPADLVQCPHLRDTTLQVRRLCPLVGTLFSARDLLGTRGIFQVLALPLSCVCVPSIGVSQETVLSSTDGALPKAQAAEDTHTRGIYSCAAITGRAVGWAAHVISAPIQEAPESSLPLPSGENTAIKSLGSWFSPDSESGVTGS